MNIRASHTFAVLMPVRRSVARRDDRPRAARSRDVESTEPEELISLRNGRRSRTHRSSRSFDALAPIGHCVHSRPIIARTRAGLGSCQDRTVPTTPIIRSETGGFRPSARGSESPLMEGHPRLSTGTLYATMIHPLGARK
jgi:hypothetical protein